MKNSLIMSVVLLLTQLSSTAQYQKAATIGARSHYVANAAGLEYLVTVHQSQDSIEIYQPEFLGSSVYAFTIPLPSGYSIDSVYSYGFALLQNLDVGVALTAKNANGQFLGIICNTDGEIKWQKNDLISFRTLQVGNQFKISYTISNVNAVSTHIMNLDHFEEAVYPTDILGANSKRLITDTNDFRYYYINTDSNKLYGFNHNHKLIEEIPISVPAGFTLQPQVELLTDGEVTTIGATNYAVYFQKLGTDVEYRAAIINENRVVQTFANCSKIDLQERSNGSVLNLRIHNSGKSNWHVYTLSPSSGNTNTATYAFSLYSRLIYDNRFSQSAFGIPTDSFNVDFYDVYLNKKRDLQVKLGLKKTDELISWKAFHDGGSNGESKNQEVYYIWKDGSTGNYTFRVLNNKQKVLLERKNARYFEFLTGSVNKKTQFILHIPGTGTEVYEYDIAISNLVRISPKNLSTEQGYKSLTFTWHTAKNAEQYTLSLMKDTVNYDGYISFQQINDTFYTLDNFLDSGTTYYWKLDARNARTFQSQPHFFEFTTDDPSALSRPNLIAPVNGAKDVSFNKTNFNWNATKNASSYTYQVSSSVNFANYVAGDVADTFVELTSLSKNTEYFWRVRANKATSTGEWSEVFSFTTALKNSISTTSNSEWTLFPNPANHHFQLSSKFPIGANYQVFNIHGQQVWSGILQSESTTHIDVSNWQAGVYQFVLIHGGQSVQKRLVVY